MIPQTTVEEKHNIETVYHRNESVIKLIALNLVDGKGVAQINDVLEIIESVDHDPVVAGGVRVEYCKKPVCRVNGPYKAKVAVIDADLFGLLHYVGQG